MVFTAPIMDASSDKPSRYFVTDSLYGIVMFSPLILYAIIPLIAFFNCFSVTSNGR